MHALSVRQPWASLIATGRKTIETRTWSTGYRGPLLICATASNLNYPDLPCGVAVCRVKLVDCRPMTERDCDAAHTAMSNGLFAWVLADAVLVRPWRVRGRQGLFDVELPRLRR